MLGKYRVEVSLKSNYIDKYQIEGDSEFDYEIVKATIAVDWNDNIKPPTLKLGYGQINASPKNGAAAYTVSNFSAFLLNFFLLLS